MTAATNSSAKTAGNASASVNARRGVRLRHVKISAGALVNTNRSVTA